MWDQAPLEQIERALARLLVLPNDQKLLARRSIITGTDIAHPVIADVQAINDSEAKRA